ncbi:MAG: glycosyltransferase family 2 protein [Planctomycetia bacterium]
MLYVTIPTYNRAVALKATLDLILPQLHEGAQCIVFDNASTDETPNVIAAAQRQSPYLKTIRNEVNIGCGANCLRCFEIAPTGWIWLLSDDDAPAPDAISTITTEIAQYPDACYINFATARASGWDLGRKSTKVFTGVVELAENFDCWGNWIFITAGVYNLTLNRPYLPFAYLETASFAAHVALILNTLAMNPTFTTVESCRCIATCLAPSGCIVQVVTQGVYRLLALVPDMAARRIFAEKIYEVCPPAPAHGAVRKILSGMRTGDVALTQDIERYSYLAAKLHRYRLLAVIAIVCQTISPYGPRQILRWIHSLTRSSRGNDKDQHGPTTFIEQLRSDART